MQPNTITMTSTNNTLKNNTKRAKNAILLLQIVLALEAIIFISFFLQLNILKSIENGEIITDDKIKFNDNRVEVLGIIYIIAFIISTITFILWFRRAYYNLHQIAEDLLYDESAACISWFIPILNTFRPVKIMSELFSKTSETLKIINVPLDPNKGLIATWWILWIVGGIIDQIIVRWERSALDVAELIEQTYAHLFSNAMGIILSIVTIVLVRKYSVIESYLFNLELEKDKILNDLGNNL